jgi:alkylation response protein AidB-like acyl-CoA dehydrogenase
VRQPCKSLAPGTPVMSALGSSTTLLSRRDLRFLLYDWLHIEEMCDRPRFAAHSRDTFDDVLDLAEQVATERFAPHNKASDTAEPHLDEAGRVVLVEPIKTALDAYAASGLIGAAMDEAVGGSQLPQAVATATFAWFQAANVSTSGYLLLTMAAANMLLANGSAEQRARWVEPMVEGRYFGTMCLSETQAGSSLADVTTRAEPQSDGTFRLFGTKMWISGGDHELAENIVHLVLARDPDAPVGVKGISLFVVPRFLVDGDGTLGERNDVVLAGINHKMGFRGTVNTILGFGEGAFRPGGERGAVGYLVGEPRNGLAYMFDMMNEARIGVGLCATCLGYTAYLKSLRYARERLQGRSLGTKANGAPQVPIIQHADVRRMLLAQKSYVEGALALVLYCGRLVDEQRTAPDESSRARAALLLDVLTPITKSWPSQWCLAANDLAIQIHGGYGYTREYDVEQHYRDNRLNAIHEGTHGIQALDLLGRKLTMRGGAGFELLVERISATIERARTTRGRAAAHADALAAVVERLKATTDAVLRHADKEVSLANASIYLEAAGHIVLAWIWLELELTANGEDGLDAGKRQAAEYFYAYELPRVVPQLDLLRSLDTTTVEMLDAWY